MKQILDTARIIFAKETRNLLRDRRALVLLFAMPLLMPLIVVCGAVFIGWQMAHQASAGLSVAVINGDQLPALVTELKSDPKLQLVDAPTDIEKSLQNGDLMVAIEIPPDAHARMAAEESITITLTSSRGGWTSDVTTVAIVKILDEYEHDLLAERLSRHGLTRTWLNPIKLEWNSAAPTGISAPTPSFAQETHFSMMGDLFVIMSITTWIFSGGLSLLTDMTAGEKERSTIESLLVTPASRIGIVVGKILLGVTASAIIIGMWALDDLAYVLLLSSAPARALDTMSPASTQFGSLGLALVWFVCLMLPMMVMINGLVAAAGTFARNEREANLLSGVLQLLLLGVTLVAIFGVGHAPSISVYALPMVGVLVAVRDLLGGGVSPGALAVTLTAATGYAVVAILLAAYVFSREWALMRGV